jgi:hypothetical protein
MSSVFYEHDFCVITESFYFPVVEILSNPELLEKTFYQVLYSNLKSRDFFCFDSSKYDMTFMDCSCRNASYPQQGFTALISYVKKKGIVDIFDTPEIEEVEDKFTKEVKILKILNENNETQLTFYIKEKKGKQLLNQYQLTFEIKRINKGVFIYGSIAFHPSVLIKNPFTKAFQKAFESSIMEESSRKKYSSNFTSFDTVIVEANKDMLFEEYCRISNEGLDDVEEVKIYNEANKLEQVGDQYLLKWQSKSLVFIVTEYFKSNDISTDSSLSCRLLSSTPVYVSYSFTYVLKTIDEKSTLVILSHSFAWRLSPKYMEAHSNVVKRLLDRFKNKNYM